MSIATKAIINSKFFWTTDIAKEQSVMFLVKQLSITVILLGITYHWTRANEIEDNFASFQEDSIHDSLVKSFKQEPVRIYRSTGSSRAYGMYQEMCVAYCTPACCVPPSRGLVPVLPLCCFSTKFIVANSIFVFMLLSRKVFVWFSYLSLYFEPFHVVIFHLIKEIIIL